VPRSSTAHRHGPGRRQSYILLATWAISGAVLIVANPRAGIGPALLLVIALSFGCTSSVSTSLPFTQRIVVAADGERRKWVTHASVVLRGRSLPTLIAVPRGQNGEHG
jgi:hypothetical protein